MAILRTVGRREARHNKVLGKQLALFRTARGLSLEEVGRAAGIGAAALQTYESGRRAASFGRVVEIAKALNVPLVTLLGDAFGTGTSGEPARPGSAVAGDAGVALRFAQAVSALPRVRRDLLFAMAKEFSKP